MHHAPDLTGEWVDAATAAHLPYHLSFAFVCKSSVSCSACQPFNRALRQTPLLGIKSRAVSRSNENVYWDMVDGQSSGIPSQPDAMQRLGSEKPNVQC